MLCLNKLLYHSYQLHGSQYSDSHAHTLFKAMNEVLSNFYLRHLRWIKFGIGDLRKNLISSCEFYGNQHNENTYWT
jgi:hypothetical protein